MSSNNIFQELDQNIADSLSKQDFYGFKKELNILSKTSDCKEKQEILLHIFHISLSKNLIKEFKYLLKNFNLNILFSKNINKKFTDINLLNYRYNKIYNKVITSILEYSLIYINNSKTGYLPFEIINFLIQKYKITDLNKQFETLFILCAGKYPWYLIEYFIEVNNCSFLISENVNDKQRNLVMAVSYSGNTSILHNLLKRSNLFWENLYNNDYHICLENIIKWKNKNKQKFLKNLLKKYPCKIKKKFLKKEIIIQILKYNPKLYHLFLQQNPGFLDSISFFQYLHILIDTQSYKLLDIYLSQSDRFYPNKEEGQISWDLLFEKINPRDNNNESDDILRKKYYTLYKILLKYYPFNYFDLFKMEYGQHRRVLLESLAVIPRGLYLIKKYSKYIENWNHLNITKWTPILNAARYGEYQTVRYLLDNRRIKIDTNTERCGSNGEDHYNIISCAVCNIDIRVLQDCLKEISKRKIKISEKSSETFFKKIENNGLSYQEKKRRFQIVFNFFKNSSNSDFLKKENIRDFALSNTYSSSWNKWLLCKFQDIEFPTQKIFEIVCRIQGKVSSNHNNEKDLKKVSMVTYHRQKTQLIQLLLNHNIKFNKKELVIRLVKIYGILDTFMKYIFKDVISLEQIVIDSSFKNDFLKNLINHLNYTANIKLVTNQYFLETMKTIQKLNINLNNVKFGSLSCIDYIIKHCKNYLINLFILHGVSVNKIGIFYYERSYYYLKNSIIRKWLKVNYYIRLYMRRRNIKHFKQFDEKQKEVLLDLLIYPEIPNTVLSSGGADYRETLCEFNTLIQKSNPNNPVHITPFHFAHLQKSNILISEKADGITKKSLPQDIYPSIDIPLQNIKSEYISEYNLYLVFESCPIQAGLINGSSRNLVPFENFQWLRKLHPTTINLNYTYLFENIEEEIKSERKSLKQFLDKYSNSQTPIWWPKIAWFHSYQNCSLANSIQILDSLYPKNVFPIDGWIFTPNQKGTIAKYKPFEHLTIDVKHINDKWLSGDNQIVDVYCRKDTIYKNGIYRCYWNSTNQKWYAKDFREEKYKANNLDLIKNISNQQLYQWNINNFPITKQYYQEKCLVKNRNDIHFLKNQRDIFAKLFSELPCHNILDIGCGNGHIIRELPKEMESYVGLEIDPGCIWNCYQKINNSKKENMSVLWCDMGVNWELKKQEQHLKTKSIYIQEKLYQNFTTCIFDTVILNFSIHNCFQNLERLNNLITEINLKTKKGSQILISMIDLSILSGNKYYQIISNYQNSISKFGIKYKFPWSHKKFISEPIISSNKLINILETKKWKCIQKINYDNLPEENIWKIYQKSTTWLKFTKIR